MCQCLHTTSHIIWEQTGPVTHFIGKTQSCQLFNLLCASLSVCWGKQKSYKDTNEADSCYWSTQHDIVSLWAAQSTKHSALHAGSTFRQAASAMLEAEWDWLEHFDVTDGSHVGNEMCVIAHIMSCHGYVTSLWPMNWHTLYMESLVFMSEAIVPLDWCCLL